MIIRTILLLFLMCSTASAVTLENGGVMMMGGGFAAVAGECDYVAATGTFTFGYTGDQVSGDIYGCLDGAAVEGTESGAGVVTVNGRSGNGVEINANGEYLSFNKTHSWLEVNGQMWVKLSATSGDNNIIEAYGDVDDFFYIRAQSDNTLYVRFNRSGTGNAFSTVATVPDNTWFLLAFNIDNGGSICGGGQEIGIRIDANGDGEFGVGENWECESGDDVSAMGTAPTTFRLGVGQASDGRNNNIYIDDVYINFR